MNAEQLSRVGEKLVKRCGSRDPFEIARDFAFKKKSPILPIIYETKRGIKIRNKNYSFFMYKQSKRTPFRV